MDLTLVSLKQVRIIDFSNYQGMLNFLCCDRYNEQCLSRKCVNCKTRYVHYNEFDNSVLIKHPSCITENILDTKIKKIRKVRKYTKKVSYCAPKDIVMKLEENISTFLKHEVNIVH